MNYKEKIKAYKSILKLVTDDISEDRLELSKYSLEQVVQNLEVSEKFGIPLQSITNNHAGWLKVGKAYDDHMCLGLFGENYNRTISWSDDKRQPKKTGEWLLKIGFPAGAYIFGDSYPVNTFKDFWDELKAHNPKFCDTANHYLYFSHDNAKAVYDAFYVLFNKYAAKVNEEMKEQRKQKLLEELARLESQ